MNGVAGRTVVLTGAAGGLGTEIAEALSTRGARLVLVDVDGVALTALCRALGCAGVVADVADADGRREVVEVCEAHPPDVLVHNAGLEKASEYGDLDPGEVRHAMEVNLLGAMLLTHDLLAGMRRRGRGHVITMASLAAIKPVPFNAVYNTAKAGLVAFSTSLSKELEGSGVHATVICPSAVTGVGMWARAAGQLRPHRLVDASTIGPQAVVEAVLTALERHPRRILVGSPLVRAGALLSALSPTVDRLTDRLSGMEEVYRERIGTDSGRRL